MAAADHTCRYALGFNFGTAHYGRVGVHYQQN
jgi:hypothetical protein